MSAEQKLITIDDISEENAPTIFVTGGLSRFLQAVKDEVCAEVPDLTTRKGRERIASLSATVSKRKAAVEKPGRVSIHCLQFGWLENQCALDVLDAIDVLVGSGQFCLLPFRKRLSDLVAQRVHGANKFAQLVLDDLW